MWFPRLDGGSERFAFQFVRRDRQLGRRSCGRTPQASGPPEYTWWQVPKVRRGVAEGKPFARRHRQGIIIALCGLSIRTKCLIMPSSFWATASRIFRCPLRMTIANMTTEWGALAGVFPFDEATVNYLRSRCSCVNDPHRPGKRRTTSRSGYREADIDRWWKNRRELSADAEADYAIELELDLPTVVPHVSGPNEDKTMVSLPEIERKQVAIQKAYLLSCVNARFEDCMMPQKWCAPVADTSPKGGILSRSGERGSAGQVREKW